MKLKRTLGVAVIVMAVIALFGAVVACYAPAPVATQPAAQTGPVHVILDNAYEIGAAGESDLAAAAGDTNFTNLVLSGDLTVDGTSTLSGGVAWDWPQSVTAPTAVATATPAFFVNNVGAANNAFEVRDAATPVFVIGQAGVGSISGAMTLSGGITGPLVVTGPTAVATATPAAVVNNTGAGNVSFEVRDAATPVFQVLNGGAVAANAVYSYVPVSAKTGNYSVTTADTGLTIKSSGSITMTLPGAVAGLQYCIVNYDGGDLTLDFVDATDVALNEVNAPGDRVTNTTAYDSICLRAIDTTNWITVSSLGTWADGN